MYCFSITMQDEIDHVRLLRATLGSDAVDMPPINIGASFAAAADAAVDTTLSPSFSPYENDISFYLASFIFEDVGVTAYKVSFHSVQVLKPWAGFY